MKRGQSRTMAGQARAAGIATGGVCCCAAIILGTEQEQSLECLERSPLAAVSAFLLALACVAGIAALALL